MQASYIKAVTHGLIMAGTLIATAVTGGLVLFVTIAITQSGLLVAWLPVVLIALFTFVTMAVLQKDAAARKR